ncbi:MAG: 3-phosphoshikimate 1-carboxyvinyltransferase [Chitinophagales bacterium]|nr:3-phosphoshikimate 1-carboxyvinyltransferase [Chitinophagales bacterium]
MKYLLAAPKTMIAGTIVLEGSKSISNRILLMRALCAEEFPVRNLSPSDDTNTLQLIIMSDDAVCDVGAAGTTMRFLIAYFAIVSGERILTGSERMKQRPVKILVDALRELGADITYLEKEGYPPIKIIGKKLNRDRVAVKADVSSQYISALLMIAPRLENGLRLELTGKISSYPYIRMTLKLMASLHARYDINGNIFTVHPGTYAGKELIVESDWSAASYYFSICALAKGTHIQIRGLFPESLQGDSVLPEIYNALGVKSYFENEILHIVQTNSYTDYFMYDFSDCPDLAQTAVVTCAALGIPGTFTGLESLKIKETDRTNALRTELKKFGVQFYAEGEAWKLEGKTTASGPVEIKTYEDHRMAMCFAPISIVHDHITIEDTQVVKKSYPSFWDDLASIGFSFSSVD